MMTCSVLIPVAAQAETIPTPIEKMIRAAAATGDATKLSTTVDLAKQTTPESVAEIDTLVAELNKSAEEVRVAKLQSQGFFEGWSGQGEAGASVSTGNTETTGVALGLGLAKESLRWRHSVTAAVDYVRNDGETQKQRYFAGYEGNYKFSDNLYVLGLLSWEKDRFAGFSRRFSEAVGIGYSPIKTPTMSLNLEAGPALRQTAYIDGRSENKIGGRGALDYRWVIRPGLIFTEKASAYLQSDNSTLTSTTAVDVKLIGALSGRASFLVQHETDPPIGLKNTNTTSRLTLVYGF
jgi:putative salt-induced outer membrane protein